ALDLAAIAGAYLLRECLNVGRRYLVEGTCLSIEKETNVRLVAHLMRLELAAFTHERVGALHGRIHPTVGGLGSFRGVISRAFFPAGLPGAFALAATAGKQPWLGLLMAGVAPLALSLTLWQLVSQKGIRLALMRSKEGMDGTVVEQLSGL